MEGTSKTSEAKAKEIPQPLSALSECSAMKYYFQEFSIMLQTHAEAKNKPFCP